MHVGVDARLPVREWGILRKETFQIVRQSSPSQICPIWLVLCDIDSKKENL